MVKSLKSLYSIDFLWRIFVYNTLIAALIVMIKLAITGEIIWQDVIVKFIYSHSIGWSLAIPLKFIGNVYRDRSPVIKSLLMFCSLIFFGSVGAIIGFFGVHHLLFPGMELLSWWKMVVVMGMTGVIFGFAAFLYFEQREKLIKTINDLKEKEIEQERLKQLQKTAELEALRAKLNPHFLFNTFNSIASLIRIDPERAEQMVEKLSSFFRYTLISEDKKTVSLEEEITILTNYLEIEKVRLGSRLNYQIDVAPSLLDRMIPPLLIQPIVENSIIHAIGKKIEGGTIRVEAKKVERWLQITISDNGEGFDYREEEIGFGLSSIEERLKLLYKGKAVFTINKNAGTVTTIKLPEDEGD